MKRVISLLLVFAFVFSFSSCAKNKEEEPITIYVGLGNTMSGYYDSIKALIEEKLGYDVQFVYNNTSDTTNSLVEMAKNDDLPADIIFNASLMPDNVQKTAFLDFNAVSNLSDLFPITQQQQVLVDGSIYQLPLTSRLIGIEYNKTLLEENGWKLPNNFSEMVDLKQKADAAGVQFAVSAGAATGHGFNYLFHLMGSDYIYSPTGTEWYNNFMVGTDSSDAFKAESAYFKEFVEAGLFGEYYDVDWSANKVFVEKRALFYFNILNDVYSGFQYDSNGELAAIDGQTVKVVESETGNAVMIDGRYYLYDENEHAGLKRYEVTGAVIYEDEYATMPWITENGVGNFTIYNNLYAELNASLGEKSQKDKLNKCIDILELMTKQEAQDIYLKYYLDGVVYVNDATIDSTRLFADFKSTIEQGNLQPWYYNDFDVDSIVKVGEVVNSYISGKYRANTEYVCNFDDIFTELTFRRDEHLKNVIEYCATVSETLDFYDVARLECIANGISAQAAIDEAGIKADVTVSILPYCENIKDLPAQIKIPVVQMKMYKGKVQTSIINAYYNSITVNPIVVVLTGSEINEFVETGYKSDASDKTFKIAMMTKNNVDLAASKNYYVVVPKDVLSAEEYERLDKMGLVVKNGEKDITGKTGDGLLTYFEKNTTISKSTISWK